MTQAALRFILSYEEVATVIPGAKNLQQLKESISAAEEAMPREYVQRLNEIWEREIKNCKFEW